MRREPLKVRLVLDKSAPPGRFALRAFEGKREVGVITGKVRDGDSLVTGFMSTRYAIVGGRRQPVLLSDHGERERVPHEDYTGRGVGKAMLDALAKEACRRGADARIRHRSLRDDGEVLGEAGVCRARSA